MWYRLASRLPASDRIEGCAMLVITAGLLAVVLLKILAVVNAIRWLHTHGPAFAMALAEEPPRTVVDQERLYDRLGADFFPFGVKDYRIRRMARSLRGPRGLLVGWPARVFRVLLFNLALLAALTAAYLIVLASAPRIPDVVPRPAHDAVALVLALSLIVATILIATETACATPAMSRSPVWHAHSCWGPRWVQLA